MVFLLAILVIYGAIYPAGNDSVEQVDEYNSIQATETEQKLPEATAAIQEADTQPERAFTPISKDTLNRTPDILPIMKSVKAHFSAGSFAAALSAVNIALQLDELDYEATKYKGMIFLMKGNSDSAKHYLDLALTAEGDDSELDLYAGMLSGSQKKFREAEAFFSKYPKYSHLDPNRERLRKYALFIAPKAAREWAAGKIATNKVTPTVYNKAVWLSTTVSDPNDTTSKNIARAIDALMEPLLAKSDSLQFIDALYVRTLERKTSADKSAIAAMCEASKIFSANISINETSIILKAVNVECTSESMRDSLPFAVGRLANCILESIDGRLHKSLDGSSLFGGHGAKFDDISTFGGALALIDNEKYAEAETILSELVKRNPRFNTAKEYLAVAKELAEVESGRVIPSTNRPLRPKFPETRQFGIMNIAGGSTASVRAMSIATSSFMPEKSIDNISGIWRPPFLDATNSGAGAQPRRIITTRVPVPEP